MGKASVGKREAIASEKDARYLSRLQDDKEAYAGRGCMRAQGGAGQKDKIGILDLRNNI